MCAQQIGYGTVRVRFDDTIVNIVVFPEETPEERHYRRTNRREVIVFA